ncbi:MAG: helix-turn-helix transcriptional regulator, partial [Bacteroidales bacterium]|nr:helix-turn-helix transcriptional regulator [Bacteroidales bacterium]
MQRILFLINKQSEYNTDMPLQYFILFVVVIAVLAVWTYLFSRKQKQAQIEHINRLLEDVAKLRQRERMKLVAERAEKKPNEVQEKGMDEEEEEDLFLARVIELAHRLTPSGNATIEAIAAGMHMSVSTFRRRILAITGESPKTFLIAIRMREAANGLTETDKPLKVIAEKCGFSEVSSFARTFKRIYGMTPTEYRTQAANKQTNK